MSNINPKYIDENGHTKMCPICRNVRMVKEPEEWVLDTVLYVDSPKSAVLETCPVCLSNKEG